MLTGKGNAKNAAKFRCVRTGGSQLQAAERFLKAHHGRGQVALVTVDIGANDVDGCTDPGVDLLTCVTAGQASIKQNVPAILKALRGAAARDTGLAAMTLYDPILSDLVNPAKSGLVPLSVAFLKSINGLLTSADAAAGFKTADIAGAFASYDSADTIAFNGQSVPVNVARVCSWTWACTPPPSGPNIHANKNGYAQIAAAFARVLGRL
jgi:lysophospholipase L1-like esterase